jgi:cysteine desulfurase/selenocysteine lyase
MTVAISRHNGVNGKHASTKPYNVENIREYFPALSGEKIPLNNATGSLVYEGAVKALVQTVSLS